MLELTLPYVPPLTCKHCSRQWVPGRIVFGPLECSSRPRFDGIPQPCEPAESK